MGRERDFSMDAVRAGAVILVIAVHFFLYTGFYELPLSGPTMALCAWLRMLFMSSVPLFLLLSGYFCVRRRWSKRYLLGLAPILLTYVICGVLCRLFMRFSMHDRTELRVLLLCFLDFSAAPYGWYVEMYLGLYLLMPLLNAGWQGLRDGGRSAALISLLVLTALPTVTNLNCQILPDWWLRLYPITYYLLGCRLRESPKLIRKTPGWALLLGWFALAAAAAAMHWRLLPDGSAFEWAAYVDYSSPFVVGASVCAFSLLGRARDSGVPRALRFAVTLVARLSLPIFLLSYMFDSLFYPLLNGKVELLKWRLPFLPLTVAAVLICSTLLAWPVGLAEERLKKLLTGQTRMNSKEDAADEH